MPNCFQLIDKTTNEPAVLNRIDEKIAALVGLPCDPRNWCLGWYDLIGFEIAMGKDLHSDELTKFIEDRYLPDDVRKVEMTKILTYLRENYTSSAWSER
jgi:hypothetical protein